MPSVKDVIWISNRSCNPGYADGHYTNALLQSDMDVKEIEICRESKHWRCYPISLCVVDPEGLAKRFLK